jgi:hypothetical protein
MTAWNGSSTDDASAELFTGMLNMMPTTVGTTASSKKGLFINLIDIFSYLDCRMRLCGWRSSADPSHPLSFSSVSWVRNSQQSVASNESAIKSSEIFRNAAKSAG